MRFVSTPLAGAFLIELERIPDERGFFSRAYCQREFAEHGLETATAQCNVSFNRQTGTLRGLHYQIAPHAEAKLVRCTSGRIFDVIVDLRPDSPSRYRWHAAELSASNRRMLYVPKGFAHGFQTLADDTEVFYQMSESYHPESARGLRWNDPRLGIEWPIGEPTVSEKDRGYPLMSETHD